MDKKKEKSKAKLDFTLEKLRAMNDDQIKQQKEDLLKEQFNLTMQLKINQLKNTAQLKTLRRNIAKIKTILNEKRKEANL